MSSDKDWFEVWFDSPYYPLLYKKRNFNEAKNFIDSLLENLQLDKKAQILDLACGEGRHSRYLSEKGFDVTGIDLSERSIEIAKEYESDNLKFEIEDMRTFELNTSFDLVLNLFTSFGYFNKIEDNLKVLVQVKKHIKKNGSLIIDFLNSVKTVENLVPEESKVENGFPIEIERKVDNNQVVKTIRINAEGEIKSFEERVQLIDLKQFNEILANSGFQLIKTFGNYKMENFDEKQSDRLIIFATPK